MRREGVQGDPKHPYVFHYGQATVEQVPEQHRAYLSPLKLSPNSQIVKADERHESSTLTGSLDICVHALRVLRQDAKTVEAICGGNIVQMRAENPRAMHAVPFAADINSTVYFWLAAFKPLKD